jgi:hypothetical protein
MTSFYTNHLSKKEEETKKPLLNKLYQLRPYNEISTAFFATIRE